MSDEIENPFTSDVVTLDASTNAPRIAAFANGAALDMAGSESLLSRAKRGVVDALEVEAIVFTQSDKPNRKGVRVATSALPAFAASFAGKPMLVDHRSHQLSARIGTILSSSLEQSGGTAAIRQKFRVVKQDAIVSVLDGTLDAFSIGFGRGDGAVVCSVHRTPVMENCYCWPLDKLEVDGEPKIVEYEFLSPTGDETSGVNVPAASGTKITDVRAALAAALSLSPPAKDRSMKFALLAAALGIQALTETDEATAVAAVNKLRGQLTAAEAGLEAMESRATAAETELAAIKPEITTLRAASVNEQIERAYREGRLAAKRDDKGKRIVSAVETSIRKLAAAMSPVELAAYIDEMPQIIPLGQRPVSELHDDKQERTHPADNVDPDLAISDDVLATTAAQLGITVEEMKKTHAANARARKGR